MEKDVLSELQNVTRALADSEIGNADEFKDMNSKLTVLLADIAHHIENARKSLMDVKPALLETQGSQPNAAGHLGDIDKTLADAADRLFTLTEKAISDNDKSTELLASIKESGASEQVDKLLEINKESKADLMEVFTALSFQDLAGQKIKKINTLIEEVEKRILQVLLVLGYPDTLDAEKSEEMIEGLSAAEGPLEQNLVDDILKDFGL
ncbi:MAG: protein phosphatase CheZ [Proteobacteria bacterium]|nr:protein phosphatase CheZ [Pseudomonadota bacterium]